MKLMHNIARTCRTRLYGRKANKLHLFAESNSLSLCYFWQVELLVYLIRRKEKRVVLAATAVLSIFVRGERQDMRDTRW